MLEIEPWFGGDKIIVIPLLGTNIVAYTWASINGDPESLKSIKNLIVWHNCDKSIWRKDPNKDQGIVDSYVGWHPSGVGLHTLNSVEPLDLSPSLYWPTCCDLHGFVEKGLWRTV